MSKKNIIFCLYESKKTEYLVIFILMSILNFMLSCVEHERSFITSGPGCNMLYNLHCIIDWVNVKVSHERNSLLPVSDIFLSYLPGQYR